MPVMSFGFWRNFWNSPHSPCPAVAPNAGGWLSDMSKTTDFAVSNGDSIALVIGSGYTLADMLWLPVPKPPCRAQIAAACGVARYFTNASMAGVSRNVTIMSPATSTACEFGPAVMVGQTNALKPDVGFAFVVEVITLPTKSASNTM